MWASEEDVRRVVAGFEACTLPKSEWTHAAHFAVALATLKRVELVDAMDVLRRRICAYNEAVGTRNTDTSGYHETITQASVRAAWAVRESVPGVTLLELCKAVANAEYGASGWVLRYWTRERLFSVEARRTWVAPDLAALPFGD